MTFEAESGDILGLLGPNGAGKTTLMRMLATYLSPTGGSALIAGHDLLTQTDELRYQIGYLPSTPPLYDDMRVEEYLKFVAGIRGLTSSGWREVKDKIIEQCSLGPVYRQLCGTLSTGYRKRVGIAQALLHNPKVVLLDEPYTGLDPEQLRQIRQVILEFQGEHTFIISSHMLSEIASCCNRVLIMNRGKLVAEENLNAVSGETLERKYLQAIQSKIYIARPLMKEVANS